MRVLAVDPGLRVLGAALFDDGALVKVDLVTTPPDRVRDAGAWVRMGLELTQRFGFDLIERVVVEMMVVRAGRRDVDPDDLLQLVGVAGVILGLYALSAEGAVIRPEDWKGGVKKRVHHQRIAAALGAQERALVDGWMSARATPMFDNLDDYIAAARRCRGNDYPNDPVHNLLDAVGIGLNDAGRL